MTTGRYLRLKLEGLFRFVFKIPNIIYNSETHRKVQQGVSFLYSQWLAENINKVGKGVLFFRPVEIIGGKYIIIGNMTNIGKNSIISAWAKTERPLPLITIGANCDFGQYNHITCTNNIEIGNGVLTGRWVTIADNGHGDNSLKHMKERPADRPLYSKGPIIIGDNVWIGDKSTILSGVTIGEGSIIAANSVVTHDIPPFCIAAGCPAKVIKLNA